MDSEGLLPIELDTVILECTDAAALADFYIRLLGWRLPLLLCCPILNA